MENHSPLLCRDFDDKIFALVSTLDTDEHDTPISESLNFVSVRQFLTDVAALAERLPKQGFALNLCENRYLFTLAFCAVIVRQQTNLLPQNRTNTIQSALIERYPGAYILHDGLNNIVDGAENIELRPSQFRYGATHTQREDHVDGAEPINPDINYAHTAAIAFTSGSTGEPKANIKTWNTFAESTDINAHYMLPAADNTVFTLATVPPQHMWGLETSVLMPLRHRVCVCDTKPFFPADIKTQLHHLPSPRCLISTPVHLRAIQQSQLVFPKVERTLCATSPLNQGLAIDIENAFGGDMLEVYGCSEVGSMSCRQSARTSEWLKFKGLNFIATQERTIFKVSADHLTDQVTLQDHIRFTTDDTFRLLGREDDLIEIAGKRGSLAELNKVLLGLKEVKDGVIFIPKSERMVSRPAALIVKNASVKKRDITDAFLKQLDPVFTPRPIYFVSELPREENGKLKQENLQSLLKKLQKTSNKDDRL